MPFPLAAQVGKLRPPVHARVVIRHGRLFQGEHAFRNIGVTVPDLMPRLENNDISSLTTTLLDAKRAGARFVSFPILQDAAGVKLMAESPTSFVALTAKAITLLGEAGLGAIPTIIGNAHVVNKYYSVSNVDPSKETIFTPGSPARALAVKCAAMEAAKFASSQVVLFWQAGDDLNAGADTDSAAPQSEQVRSLLADIAAALHEHDKQHLVSSGNGALRPDAWHLHLERLRGNTTPAGPPKQLDSLVQRQREMELLTPPGINIESVHLSPNASFTPRWLEPEAGKELDLPWIQYVCSRLNRPLFVSGISAKVVNEPQDSANVEWLVDVFRRLQASGMPPAAVSVWEPASSTFVDNPDALSFTQTPRLAVAMRIANGVIDNSQHNNITLTVGPPLSATDQTVTAFKLQERALRLQKIVMSASTQAIVPTGTSGNLLGGPVVVAGPKASIFTPAYASLMARDRVVTPALLASMIKITAQHTNGAAPIVCSHGLTVPPYSVPENIGLNGDTIWFPDGVGGTNQGTGSYGLLPPADLPFWFIDMVYRYYYLTTKTSLFTAKVALADGEVTRLSDLCIKAFNSVPADKDTGLISVNSTPLNRRADCSLFLGAKRSGECLWPSLLRFRAARELAAMFTAAGDAVNSQVFRHDVATMRIALPSAFFLPLGQSSNGHNIGMLISAVTTGRRDDIWGSAFALQLDAFSPDTSLAIARHLDDLVSAGGITSHGYVRTLPQEGTYGGAWELVDGSATNWLNQGYSILPLAWLAQSIMQISPDHAVSLLSAAAQQAELDWSLGGPWEFVTKEGRNHTGGRSFVGLFCASGYAMTYFAPDVAQ